jgi:hypothetical protein
MSSRESFIRVVRRSQTFISILLFLIVFFICWKFTNFDITQVQISIWGKSGLLGRVWNTAVCTFAISIFLNSILYLRNNLRIKFRNIFYLLFTFVSMCLFTVGFFNMDWGAIHNYSAGLYFFFYPLTIFLFTHLNRKYLTYKDWLHNVILSVGMAVIPMIFISMFKGMAIAEISHTILVIIYNIKLSIGD